MIKKTDMFNKMILEFGKNQVKLLEATGVCL